MADYDPGALPLNVLDQSNTSVFWKECCACFRIKPFNQFRRDASYREGVRDQCWACESSPRLSTEEHVWRAREGNLGSEYVRRQKWDHQDDYRGEKARWGNPMHSSEFLRRLKPLVSDLYITDGRIAGDLAVYRTYGRPQPRLEGRTFEYLWFLPLGWMPEFSIYEFDQRDIPLRESRRGWRTILLRLIKSAMLTEEKAGESFGKAEGFASTVWRRQLYINRNGKSPD